MLPIYKAVARSIDLIAPDIYLGGISDYFRVMAAYSRPDNALFVPENANQPAFARYPFALLGLGGIGFSVFGVDHVNTRSDVEPADAASFPELIGFSRIFELLGNANREIARLNFEGKLKTVLEGQEVSKRTLDFGKWKAIASFEHRAPDPREALANKLDGVVLVAQITADEFLVTGIAADLEFNLGSPRPNERWQFMRVEEGVYENDRWVVRRLLNGDESDFKLGFTQTGRFIHIKLGTY
jgi:hypothetical protein